MDSLSLAIIVIHAQFSRRLACYSCYVHGSKVRSRVYSSLTRPVVEILLGPVPRQCPSGNFDPRTILSNPATGIDPDAFLSRLGDACRMNEQTTREFPNYFINVNARVILIQTTVARGSIYFLWYFSWRIRIWKASNFRNDRFNDFSTNVRIKGYIF